MRRCAMRAGLGYGAGRVVESHRHDRLAGEPPMTGVITLIHLVAGAGHYRDATTDLHLLDGDLLIRRHDRAHALSWSGGCEQRRDYLIVPEALCASLRRADPDFWCRRRMALGTLPTFSRRVARLLRLLPEADLAATPLLAAAACEAIAQLTTSWHRHHDDALVVRAKELLNRRPQRSLPSIAAELHIGTSTLRRRFQQSCGRSPNRWRIEQRLERACSLLLENRSNETIAAELGYSDASAFARQFRTYTGCTPQQWRQGGS